MNREIKILSLFFILVYLSFLAHDLFAHGHHHHYNDHSGHHHLSEDEALDGLMAILWNDCNHLLNDCTACNNDQNLHKQVFFTKDFKSVQYAFIPSKKIRLKRSESEPTVLYFTGNIPFKSFSAAAVPQRGPPHNS